MKTLEKKLLETLNPAGLAFVIRSALGRVEMVRIANASRVSVPGMRNRAVSIEHLSEALADKFVAEGPSRRSILKSLQSATRSLLPAYRKLDVEELRARLAADERMRADNDLGKLLFLLITEPRDGIGADEIRAAAGEISRLPAGRDAELPAVTPRIEEESQALRREKAELSRRAADLVGLVDRLRERDRRFREDIAQRKFDVNNLKLQLAKSKKERDSLEKELRILSSRLENLEKKPSTTPDMAERMGALQSEVRRLAGAVEKLNTRPPREDRSASAPVEAARRMEEVKREIQGLRRLMEEDRARIQTLIKDIAPTLETLRAHTLAGPQAGAGRRGVQAERPGQPDKVGVFVDVQNMFYAARGQNARLDFEVLLQNATRGRRLIRAIAYVVEAKEIDQSGFIALLQQKRYEVKRKDLKVRSDGSFKGDWDMEIALDALEMAGALDVVVLVTGDGDFTGLVQKLKILGPRVEVYSFPENTAKELREAADKFVRIDKRMLIKMSRVPKPTPTGTAGT